MPTKRQVNPQTLYHRCHLLPGSRRRGLSRHAKVRCRKFLKPRNSNDRRDEESPLFDCWEGRQEHSDTLQRLDPWTLCAPMSLSSSKRLLLCEFPCVSFVPEIGCIRSMCANCSSRSVSSPVGKSIGLDIAPIEVAPCEDWLIGEVELKILSRSATCPSTANLLKQHEKQGRYREITVDSGTGCESQRMGRMLICSRQKGSVKGRPWK